ncbi:TetR family transcriptional regulator [Pseudoroseomonas rhizosphaerae]|uniref:TetR family transcriptional regulator n=1 Tax=Teichococcus rhizosphaerae TaxID=1335062 RepID=A0A2C6Y433_9PROT|nr:TetR family transcriptional regulator [Pseudoroseomonas rhizosphaerae]PHK95572.1 TetR family transcriptional regulator [Pseudoroseomonas rhizosphaerae]
MARRTKQEADETREALLDAAEQVFLDRGVARASLDEVARVAGCTRGAVHWHFRDKLGLFLALDERLVLLQDEVKDRLCIEEDGSLQSMACAITAAMKDFEENPRRRRLLTIMLQRCEYVAEMAPALQRRRQADTEIRETLRRRFQEVAERGDLSPAWPPERAALFLYALISGLLHEWLRGEADFTLSGEVSDAIRSFLDCVAARPVSGGEK